MKEYVFRDASTREVLLDLKQNAPDENGEMQAFIGVFPKTGLVLNDPYLIRSSSSRENDYRSGRSCTGESASEVLSETFPLGELVHIMTNGVVDDVEKAKEVWDASFKEAFDGIRTLGDIVIAYKWLKENDIIHYLGRYEEKCRQ